MEEHLISEALERHPRNGMGVGRLCTERQMMDSMLQTGWLKGGR